MKMRRSWRPMTLRTTVMSFHSTDSASVTSRTTPATRTYPTDSRSLFCISTMRVTHWWEVRRERVTAVSLLTQEISLLTVSHSSAHLQACLTIWWIILRFMGDIPEPKSSDAISVASSNTPQAPPSRQGRRLSNLVGLDQVNYYIYLIITLKKIKQSNYLTSSNDVISGQKILRKNKKKFDRRASSIPEEVTIILFILSFFFCHWFIHTLCGNCYYYYYYWYYCHRNQAENLTEEDDVMIGEGTTLQRPLSDLEKIHIIIGYALSKHGIW